MEKVLKNKLFLIIISILIIVISIEGYFIYYFYSDPKEIKTQNICFEEQIDSEEEIATFYVDIKGAVKKPGVYEVDEKTIVNDIVVMAGGFKSNAYKNNINLSKKVSEEMVIYIYTKSEYNKIKNNSYTSCKSSTTDITDCIDKGSTTVETTVENIQETESAKKDELEENISNLININKATKEELMTLNGIGESKANNIILYRTENGNFNSIEDIQKVSGIGSALYEQIKNNITI